MVPALPDRLRALLPDRLRPSFSDRWRPYLLLAVGLVLLLNPLYLSGWHLDDDVYRYEAFAVEYESETGLVVTSVADGDRAAFPEIDDEILCDGHAVSRQCAFEHQVFDGDVNLTAGLAGASHYRFVYLDGAFYRPTKARRDGKEYASHERVPAEEALAAVSTPETRVAGELRAVVRDGRRLSFRELDHAGELVRTSGGYYVVVATAAKQYGSGGSVCESGGDGFCTRADGARLLQSLGTLAAFAAGAVLAGRGLVSLGAG